MKEIQSHNSYRQFNKHFYLSKKISQTLSMQQANAHIQIRQSFKCKEHFKINSCNNKSHIAALGNQPTNTFL